MYVCMYVCRLRTANQTISIVWAFRALTVADCQAFGQRSVDDIVTRHVNDRVQKDIEVSRHYGELSGRMARTIRYDLKQQD